MKQIITTNNAPEAIGPYSQGINFCSLIFTSGQIPIETVSGKIPESIENQTLQALKNLQGVVEAGGSKKENILKTCVYLKDMNDFTKMNEVYAKFFEYPFPARTCVEVTRLPKDVLIEIDAIAIKE